MSGELPRRSLSVSRSASRRTRRGQAVHPGEVTERLAALEAAVANLTESQADTITATSEAADRLEKQLNRAGKELFKANALADAQQKNAETMLEQLRDSAAYRERELAQMRERLGEADKQGRLDVVRRLFPALDGLEEALASGRRRLLHIAALSDPPVSPSFWQRLNPARRAAETAEASSAQAITAWLEGLGLVQERLLEALAAVDVVAIPTVGASFDPHLHIAVETVAATAEARPGAIVREHRRGYIQGDTVLRYAEVIVARAGGERAP